MARLPRLWEEPFSLLSDMGDLIDNLEDAGFGTGYGKTDIYEKDGKLYYEIELPGLKKEDITARVEDNTLIVKGEINRDENIDEDNYLRMERRYGRFQKSFSLPKEAADTNEVKARFEDGILKITIPLEKSIRGEVIDIDIE